MKTPKSIARIGILLSLMSGVGGVVTALEAWRQAPRIGMLLYARAGLAFCAALFAIAFLVAAVRMGRAQMSRSTFSKMCMAGAALELLYQGVEIMYYGRFAFSNNPMTSSAGLIQVLVFAAWLVVKLGYYLRSVQVLRSS